MQRPLAQLCAHQAGATGAEKALLICFALAIVAVAGSLVMRGGDQAASDAQTTLMEGGAGQGKTTLGSVPIQGASGIAAGKEVAQGKEIALVSFSSDFKDGAEPPAPAPAPAPAAPRAPAPAPPGLQTTYSPLTSSSGGRITEVSIQRLGLLPRSDAILAALRDALGNQGINPETVHGIVTVWSAAQGGAATVDGQGNVVITRGDVSVLIFPSGAMMIRNDAENTNQSRDSQGRLRSYTFINRSGTVRTLARGYEFGYDQQGVLSSVQVIGGPNAGTWTRQPSGAWRNDRTGQTWSGAYGPQTWPGILGGRTRLLGIVDAANDALSQEWTRLQRMWSEALPQGGNGVWSEVTSTLRSMRTVVGMGFSGEGATVQRMSVQIQSIRAEMDSLNQLRRQIAASQDPAEIARLSDDYVRRATALKTRLDSFRATSERVLTRADRYGRAWELARDAYGLWGAGNRVTMAWNLQNLVRHSIGVATEGR